MTNCWNLLSVLPLLCSKFQNNCQIQCNFRFIVVTIELDGWIASLSAKGSLASTLHTRGETECGTVILTQRRSTMLGNERLEQTVFLPYNLLQFQYINSRFFRFLVSYGIRIPKLGFSCNTFNCSTYCVQIAGLHQLKRLLDSIDLRRCSILVSGMNEKQKSVYQSNFTIPIDKSK